VRAAAPVSGQVVRVQHEFGHGALGFNATGVSLMKLRLRQKYKVEAGCNIRWLPPPQATRSITVHVHCFLLKPYAVPPT
jgi:hypothetical protein